MSGKDMSPWEVWNSLKIARMPLALVLSPQLIAERKRTTKFPLSETAFVHRMFSLFFTLEYQPMRGLLTEEEDSDVEAFLVEFRKLPWKVIATHTHISELDDVSQLVQIREVAKRLDVRLERRTSNDLVSIGYRLVKGWTVFEPKMNSNHTETVVG